jgi:hypothetical protein
MKTIRFLASFRVSETMAGGDIDFDVFLDSADDIGLPRPQLGPKNFAAEQSEIESQPLDKCLVGKG